MENGGGTSTTKETSKELRVQIHEDVVNTRRRVKKCLNSPILNFNQKFNSVIVNKSRIHGEIGNFLGILQI